MLSRRGTAASHRRQQLTWDVMASPYCSELNLTGFINLGIAENCLMQPELLAHIEKNFKSPPATALSYGEGPNGSRRLRTALANFFNRFFSSFTPVRPQHISVSAGVTGSIERCAFELGDEGDVFLLGRPYYGAFPSEVGDRAKIRILPVSFEDVDPMSLAAVAMYEKAAIEAMARGDRVKALLLCSPHNPLGRCYSKEVLVALMRMCQQHIIHLIVDEVYALSVFENRDHPRAPVFTSVLSLDTTGVIDPALVHVLWGLSKDFGCNGLRIGCVISQANPALISAIDAHAPYRFPAAFLDYVACLILEDGEFLEGYVVENRRRLGENFPVVVAFLRKHGIPFQEGANAGLFVWADLGAAWLQRRGLRGVDDSEKNGSVVERNGASRGDNRDMSDIDRVPRHSVNKEINGRLIAKKVYLIDGDDCGSELPGYFRIVFAQPMHILVAGLARIAAALEL